MLAALDPASSWERFLLALNSDIADVQGGTTKEGIHMGVMAGTLDLLQRGYVGAVSATVCCTSSRNCRSPRRIW